MGPSKTKDLISRVFSEVAEIARVAQRRGQLSATSENTSDINP